MMIYGGASFPTDVEWSPGGVSTFAQVAAAARDSQLYAQNSNMTWAAKEEAYSRRIKRIKAATGQTLENPFYKAEVQLSEAVGSTAFETYDLAGVMGRAEADFLRQEHELRQKHPDMAEAFGPAVAQEAQAITREAETRFGQMMSARPGFSKWVAAIAGGGVGVLRDPIQAPMMALGGAPAFGRTAIGTIARTALKESAIAMGTTAVVEPAIQAGRAEAGLPAGFGQAMKDIGFSGVLGGLLGGTLAVPAAVPAAVMRRTNQRRSAIREALAAAEQARDEIITRGFTGQMEIATREIRREREQAIAATRDAIKAARGAKEASRAATLEEQLVGRADPERVKALMAQFATPIEKAKAPQSLTDFLIAGGGVKDFQGELESLGLTKTFKPFVGKLVRPGGRELDKAREAAAEAGYFPEFGSIDEAMSGTTVADLLNALDEEARTGPRFSQFDADQVDAFERMGRAQEDRGWLENRLTELASAGHDLPDDLLTMAAGRMIAEGLDSVDAVEDALTRMELAQPTIVPGVHAPDPAVAARIAEIDAELDALREPRALPETRALPAPAAAEGPRHRVVEDPRAPQDVRDELEQLDSESFGYAKDGKFTNRPGEILDIDDYDAAILFRGRVFTGERHADALEDILRYYERPPETIRDERIAELEAERETLRAAMAADMAEPMPFFAEDLFNPPPAKMAEPGTAEMDAELAKMEADQAGLEDELTVLDMGLNEETGDWEAVERTLAEALADEPNEIGARVVRDCPTEV